MDNQLATERTRVTVNGNDLPAALSAWAAGVTLVTIADDRDDVGTTVSAFIPVSLDPPLVAVSLIAGSYPAEVLRRASFPAQRFAVTLLSSAQKVIAGEFAAKGRPVPGSSWTPRRTREARCRAPSSRTAAWPPLSARSPAASPPATTS